VVSVRVRTKHAEKTHVGLWGQSAILKAVWDVTEHVSLSFNKKQHLNVCKRYGNNNVLMIPISYEMHIFMLRVFNASANGLSRKFQEHMNHNIDY
jgi:hypothetical protein